MVARIHISIHLLSFSRTKFLTPSALALDAVVLILAFVGLLLRFDFDIPEIE
jgi:hypothetical protein